MAEYRIARVLGDQTRCPQFIEMVHGRDYRFIAPVTVVEPFLRGPIRRGWDNRLRRALFARPAFFQYASENALQRSAHQEAVTHLTQGIALLAQWSETPERTQQELVLQVALGPGLMVIKSTAGSLKASRPPTSRRPGCCWKS